MSSGSKATRSMAATVFRVVCAITARDRGWIIGAF
jgi:hypothetical protein